MHRRFLPFLGLCALPFLTAPLAAEPTADWSKLVADSGLASAETAIAALPAPTPDDLFALGGVRFLRGIEQALHQRWAVGATEEMVPLPVLRLALPSNPSPSPAPASLVRDLFDGLLTSMDTARAALDAIPPGAEIGLTIRLDDLWFDIDGSGSRGPAEGLILVTSGALLDPWQLEALLADPGVQALAVRFDSADAPWLQAYTHLVAAIAEFTLAFDPTLAVARVQAAAADKRDRLGGDQTTLSAFLPEDVLDKIAIAVLALRQQPDPARTRAVRQHLLQMVALNRVFWAAVAAETDNQSEWIPNPRQTSALGVALPPDTGPVWLAILDELERMLTGRLLVPHAALPAGSGVDIGRYLENPAPLDLLGWVHGMDALPYAARGPVITGETWQAFLAMTEGRGLLFAALLN